MSGIEESSADCTCEHYVVDYSDPERYHPENVDSELTPGCPEHDPAPAGTVSRLAEIEARVRVPINEQDQVTRLDLRDLRDLLAVAEEAAKQHQHCWCAEKAAVDVEVFGCSMARALARLDGEPTDG